MDAETKSAMLRAAEEIRSLRRRNEILDAKVSTMELFATVLNTRPSYPERGFAEDAAWRLEKLVAEADEKAAAAA